MTTGNSSLTVENVVGSAELGRELDLPALAEDLPNTTHAHDQFPGLIHRNQSPKGVILVFRSGKLVCTGAKRTADVGTALEQFVDELRALGIQIDHDPEVTIQNIVTSGDLGVRLNLNAVAVGLGLENIEYEPEQFPGLVYRLDSPSVVSLLFASGKLVLTGAAELSEAEAAFESVRSQLRSVDLLGSPR